MAKQGDVGLLKDPIAKQLLTSTVPARLAYTWLDGTPRVVPIWFHWNGEELVFVSPPKAPKLRALRRNGKVAITIDDNTYPHKVLLVRGSARVEMVDGIAPEYAASARRYFGEEQGRAWVEQVGSMVNQTGRIVVRPEWVGILDFQTRFPSALS